MSPDDQIDLGANIDTLLAKWPAPLRDEAAWERAAEEIVAKAKAEPSLESAALTALFGPPSLLAEPGEPSRSSVSVSPTRAGDKLMSERESNPGASAKPESGPTSIPPTSVATSKRPSLKELAARASQAGAASSMRGSNLGSVPPPLTSKPISDLPPPPTDKPVRTGLASVPPRALGSVPPAKIPDGGSKEDSGIVNLNTINSSATPEQIAAAEKAQPATHDLGDEGVAKAAVAAAPTNVASLAEARAKREEKKGGRGALWGGLVAVVGVAAAVVIMMRGKPQPTTTVEQAKPVEAPAAQATEAPKVAEAPKPTSTGLSIDALPDSTAEAPKTGPAGGSGGGEKVAAATTTTPEAAPTPAPLTTANATGGKPGDLASEMAARVGGGTNTGPNTDDAVPAAGGKGTGNQSIPEKPSQGSVASAVGVVMPGAKACVAGADDVSRANITFGSNGKVQNVSVSGWASSNGKTGCVKSALQGASVGPFSAPTFSVGVTIRP